MYSALIVDDEAPARQLLKALGRWNDIHVTNIYEADSAQEGLTIAQIMKPDIILCDMQMPVQDGVYFLKELEKNLKLPKVLVISGYTSFEYTHQAIVSKVFNYLVKPINRVELNKNLFEMINALEEERANKTPELPPDAGDFDVITSIKQYVEKNYSQSLSLEQLSSHFFISKEHISRCFKKKYGIGLFDFVNECRMSEVKKLLKATSYSVDEIAEKTGYSCGNYLSKAFKKQFGITPGEYRFHD